MYQHNNHSDMYKLSTQQHVSLDIHQNRVNNGLRWQKYAQASTNKEQQPATVTRLRLAFATILNIFIK